MLLELGTLCELEWTLSTLVLHDAVLPETMPDQFVPAHESAVAQVARMVQLTLVHHHVVVERLLGLVALVADCALILGRVFGVQKLVSAQRPLAEELITTSVTMVLLFHRVRVHVRSQADEGLGAPTANGTHERALPVRLHVNLEVGAALEHATTHATHARGGCLVTFVFPEHVIPALALGSEGTAATGAAVRALITVGALVLIQELHRLEVLVAETAVERDRHRH